MSKKLFCENCIKHSGNCRCPGPKDMPKGIPVPQGSFYIDCAGCGNRALQGYEIVPVRS